MVCFTEISDMWMYSPLSFRTEMGESLFTFSHFNFKEKLNIFDHFMILKAMVNTLVYFLPEFVSKYIFYT